MYIRPYSIEIILYIEWWCCSVLHLHYNFVVVMMPLVCTLFTLHFTEQSIITQAASQWVLCLSGSLQIVLIYLYWL